MLLTLATCHKLNFQTWASLSYAGNLRLSSHPTGCCVNPESKSNHVEHSSKEPTFENTGWSIKIKLDTYWGGRKSKNNVRLCYCYLPICDVTGTEQKNGQDSCPMLLQFKWKGTEQGPMKNRKITLCPRNKINRKINCVPEWFCILE